MTTVHVVTKSNYEDYEGGDTDILGVYSSKERGLELIVEEMKARGKRKFEPDANGHYQLSAGRTSYQEWLEINEFPIDGDKKEIALALARQLKLAPDPAVEERLNSFRADGVVTLQEIINA